MDSLANSAVQSALNGKWKKAVYFNKKIIDSDPKNIPALNRLAFSYLQLSKPDIAANIYKKILKIDPENPLVEKNLIRAKNSAGSPLLAKPPSPDVFISEAGKTRQVLLVNTAAKPILSLLHTGQKVELCLRKKSIEIRTKDKAYIGALPDDISFQIKSLIKKGRSYAAYIKRIDIPKIYIFIRQLSSDL